MMVGGAASVVAYFVTMFVVLFVAVDVGVAPTEAQLAQCG
jgi:hypothetical protein